MAESTVRLIHGDALCVLRELGESSVDAVITDPPYNAINRASGGLRSFDKGVADSAPVDIESFAEEFVRVSRGSVYVWCSDEQYTAWTLAFKSRGLTTRKCAWWKTNPSPMNGTRLWLSALELCVFARKPGAYFAKHCAHPVWKGPVARVKGHPTPKPVWLMREAVLASVPETGVVLDPFMGSGTTGVASATEGRSFIGVDQELSYVELARHRIAEIRGG